LPAAKKGKQMNWSDSLRCPHCGCAVSLAADGSLTSVWKTLQPRNLLLLERAIEDALHLPRGALRFRNKSPRIVFARRLAWGLAHERLGMNFIALGRWLGGEQPFHWTTVIYQVRRFQQESKSISRIIAQIEKAWTIKDTKQHHGAVVRAAAGR
jgi:hypothetical protein